MKCYVCKAEPIYTAYRAFMEPRTNREKAKFRDLCPECYTDHRRKQGYTLIGNVWTKG